jgi:histone H3/H4
MFNFRKKEKKDDTNPASFQWDATATQALEQAMSQAPVPKMLKGKVKKELKNAAETAAQAANRTTVTAEDLMQGMLAKMPSNMRSKVEDAMQKGPEGLKSLEDEFGNK